MRPVSCICGAVAASLVLLGGRGVGAAQPASPSFDCAKARTADERAICGDVNLAQLDQAVAIAYGQVAARDRSQAQDIARETLASRRRCGGDRLCILDQQVRGLESLAAVGARVPVPPWVGAYRLALFASRPAPRAVQGLPTRLGQCTVTKIASITTRFGDPLKPPAGDMDSGSAVTYANQGAQVSYSFVPPLAASRIGDDTLLCLVSIPKDCPPGDNRGREYSGTNLRTKGSWIMPDSQHMCGGA